jgi:CubicO group peptidase (beta-lactamase class C family)
VAQPDPPAADLAEPALPETDLAEAVAGLERGRDAGWHLGAQLYVSLRGDVLVDTAIGEAVPGRKLRIDDIMLWYSSGKPWTTVAVLRLWEQGRLGLDDLVGDHLDGWGNGKERATIRHVLTHTGGFPLVSDPTYDADVTYAEALAVAVDAPAQWEPGTLAGYHPASGWRVLGAIVEQVDGRPIDQYVREEIAKPLGLDDCYLGIPLDTQREYGDRIAPVHWTGHRYPSLVEGGIQMVPWRIDEVHNEPWHVAKVEPGGGMRGPARELGRFYESLIGQGDAPPVLEPQTVEAMTAVHRYGLRDATFGNMIPWGLGVQIEFSGGPGRRAFGHGGMASSRGLADPELGLVIVIVANGLAGYFEAEQRVLDVTDAVYSALGDDAARVRRPTGSVQQALGFSA